MTLCLFMKKFEQIPIQTQNTKSKRLSFPVPTVRIESIPTDEKLFVSGQKKLSKPLPIMFRHFSCEALPCHTRQA